MSTPPTPSFQPQAPQPSTNQPSPDIVAARIGVIRAELERAGDPALRAALHYEIARNTERLGDESATVREYLASYNADPTFRPPLHALIRLFEKRRSYKNLARLYEAEAQSATTVGDRASALVDLALLNGERLGEHGEAVAVLEEVIDELEQAGEPTVLPALILERAYVKAGLQDSVIDAVARRAPSVGDPSLKATLLGELARSKAGAGEVDAALSLARQSVSTATEPADRYRALELLEEIARRHGRAQELVAALEGRAALVGKLSRREVVSESGEVAPTPPPESDAAAVAGTEAAVLLREAARLRARALHDLDGAMVALRKALSLRPEDLALRRELMLLAERSGDRDRAAEEARYLLERGVTGHHAAPLHFRIAEAANARGDADIARDALLEALDIDPHSAVAAATLEELALSSGQIEAWIARLADRAERSEGELRSRLAWYAAHLESTRDGADLSNARKLYEKAATGSPDPTTIWREALGSALRNADPIGARTAARALVDRDDIDEIERSAVLRDLHELERVVLEDDAAANEVLRRALSTPAAQDWAGDVARLTGAAIGLHDLTAEAHELLAARALSAEAAAAHWCAAGRAYVRAGWFDAAIRTLESAANRLPGHRYAVALLEELYHAKGDADAVVRLLRASAEADRSGHERDTGLVLAAAAAESAGDRALAVRTYQEALQREPEQLAPLLALVRIAESTSDTELALQAHESLAEREMAHGLPGRWTIELAELLQLRADRPDHAEPLLRRIVAETSELGPFAGLDLALATSADLANDPEPSRWREAQLVGTEALFDHANGSTRVSLMRELGGIAIDSGGLLAKVDASTFADLVLKEDPENTWGLFTRLRTSWQRPADHDERAGQMLALADASMDAATAADLVVHALRAAALSGNPDDDAVFRAIDLEDAQPGSELAAALAIESLSEADDPGERADAIEKWRDHVCGSSERSYRAAQARALAAAGRAQEAVPLLRRIVEESPDDLASWEALRGAARDIEEWSDVALACDRLSEYLGGELRAMLLEEAATIWMDHLGNDDEAETRLRRAIFETPDEERIRIDREVAYWRLHDLLAERGDERRLMDLVRARAQSTREPAQLIPVHYELARLHRSLGERERALEDLERLMHLDPEHLGGLALLVELQVQREAWAPAVDALRALASARDVPASQQRIARLGAADFLEKKLGDPASAIAELEAIEALGLADGPLYERMTSLAEAAGLPELAASILAKVSALTFNAGERAAVERRAASIYVEQLGDTAAAIRAYHRALEAIPTDLEAAQRLADLLDMRGRDALDGQLEYSLRDVLAGEPLMPDALRGIGMLGRWRGDRTLEIAMYDALLALGQANDEEREILAQRGSPRPVSGELRISDRALLALYAEGLSGPALEFAVLASETLAEMDRLTPASLGLGRGDQIDPRSPTPLSDELQRLASLFGAPAAEVWVGGHDPRLLTYLSNQRGKPAWILGSGIASPLPPMLRFEVGRCAVASRIGLAPLIARSEDQTATDLFAIAAAAGVQFPLAHHRPGVSEATKLAQKALSRRVKRGLPEIAQKIHDGGHAILTMSQAAQMTFSRGGVLAAGELTTVLAQRLGVTPSLERIERNLAALDLFRFWTSPASLAVRRELGLTYE